MKDVAIILLNYNGSLDTIECVQSLNNMITDYKYDIYIWDNNSRKSEIDILKEYLKNDTLPDSTNITPHISIISDRVPRL